MLPANLHDPLSFINSIFDNLSELILVCDLESCFIYSNEYTAKLFGYPNVKTMLGIDPFGMRCAASGSASTFIEQDKNVREKGHSIQILDIHTYADNAAQVLLTKKTPLYDSQRAIIGTICHSRELSNSVLRNLSLQLATTDQRYKKKESKLDLSYTQFDSTDLLSKRELECLFFLLRGKTMIQISEILFLSKRTVVNHIANIKSKLNIQKKSELIDYGINQGYLSMIPSSLLRQEISIIID